MRNHKTDFPPNEGIYWGICAFGGKFIKNVFNVSSLKQNTHKSNHAMMPTYLFI